MPVVVASGVDNFDVFRLIGDLFGLNLGNLRSHLLCRQQSSKIKLLQRLLIQSRPLSSSASELNYSGMFIARLPPNVNLKLRFTVLGKLQVIQIEFFVRIKRVLVFMFDARPLYHKIRKQL